MAKKVEFNKPENYSFDGISPGTNFKDQILSKNPFNAFCDSDPIDGGNRALVVYTATECRKTRFPEDTSVLMYLPYDPDDNFGRDIRLDAIAVFHGNYFDERSDFPVKINTPLKDYDIDGEPRISHMRMMTLRTYEKDISLITLNVAGNEIVGGYVLGKMPDDRKTESWRAIYKTYRRFMPDKVKVIMRKARLFSLEGEVRRSLTEGEVPSEVRKIFKENGCRLSRRALLSKRDGIYKIVKGGKVKYTIDDVGERSDIYRKDYRPGSDRLSEE